MVKKELTKKDLGARYMIATVRTHNLITEFYEDLFDQDGNPRTDPGNVANMCSAIRLIISEELDLVKDSAYEYFEANLDDKSEQEALFLFDRKSRRGTL
jgi:hypothetical protein